MPALLERLRQLEVAGRLQLPLPGGGRTALRHDALLELGREDLSLARLAEAHTDALAILAEGGRAGQLQALYGVWAADGPGSQLLAVKDADGAWRLNGRKQFCSGSTLLDAALVTAHAQEGLLLFEVPLHAPGVSILSSNWKSPAFADTATGPVAFNDVCVPAQAVIGAAGWYLTRPGFWHGAIGPAACWAGGALSLVDAVRALGRRDPHTLAQLGALESIAWGLEAVLNESGREVDLDPRDESREARRRALKVRHLIERWSTEVIDRFGRATGPHLLAFDDRVSRQYAGLGLYIRQSHAERDLATIPALAGGP